MRFFAKVASRRRLPLVFLFIALMIGVGLSQALWPGNSATIHATPAGSKLAQAPPPTPTPTPTPVVSQGVAAHGAAAWDTAGYRGSDVKVGIIDSGFDGPMETESSSRP